MERSQIKTMWDGMSPILNERQRRQYAATLSQTYGYGGATVVHEVTGISLNTITAGKRDLESGSTDDGRVRKPGGGPKRVEEYHPDIQAYVREIVDASTYGDPERVLSWTTESLRKISDTLLKNHKIKVSHVTIGETLCRMGYSKQANQKMLQVGEAHPDRNAQFEHIAATAKEFLAKGEPVISVDTKKKEVIGNFKNSGREYRMKKDARKVLDHDFPIKELGKVAPYGIYNLNHNVGFVNLGTSHDTPEFAVESIARWWKTLGKSTFPNATRLLITCDCGGSNGNRRRIWKYRLSQLAQQIGLDVYVSHFPPGTSKWNKVEHRLFCFISKNWQGQPLVDVQTAINLIGATTTKAGLKVTCVQDSTTYELAKKVSDEDFDAIPMSGIPPFEQWNYVIRK
jgi:hypothetical protein